MLRDGSNVFCWGTSPPELTIGQEQCRWKNPVRNSTGLNSPLSFFVAQPPADFGFQLLWLCYDWFHFHFWIWFIANDPPPDTKKPRMAQPRYQPLMQLPSLLAQPPQQQLLWTRGQLSSLDHWGYFSVGSIYSNSRRLELWAGRFIRSDLFMYNNNIYIYCPKFAFQAWQPYGSLGCDPSWTTEAVHHVIRYGNHEANIWDTKNENHLIEKVTEVTGKHSEETSVHTKRVPNLNQIDWGSQKICNSEKHHRILPKHEKSAGLKNLKGVEFPKKSRNYSGTYNS